MSSTAVQLVRAGVCTAHSRPPLVSSRSLPQPIVPFYFCSEHGKIGASSHWSAHYSSLFGFVSAKTAESASDLVFAAENRRVGQF